SAGPSRCVLEYDVEEGVVLVHGQDCAEVRRGSIFTVLAEELARRRLDVPEGAPPGPLGGFVGYLGYECKADCASPNRHSSDVPDATMLLANRLVTVDHVSGDVHLIALATDA